jgi:hypothetical protein
MSQGEQCPICQSPANRSSRPEYWLKTAALIPYYRCQTCGDFVMPDVGANRWQNDHRGRGYKLSAFVRGRHIHQTGAPMLLDSLEGLPERPKYAVLIDDALKAFPRSVPGCLDRSLINLARLSSNTRTASPCRTN